MLIGKYDIREKYLFWCPVQPPLVCRFKYVGNFLSHGNFFLSANKAAGH